MALSEQEKKSLEDAKKKIEEVLKKDEVSKKKDQDWVDYGSRDRRDW